MLSPRTSALLFTVLIGFAIAVHVTSVAIIAYVILRANLQ